MDGISLTGPKVMLVRGLVTFVPAVAYHFCLNLPSAFMQRLKALYWAQYRDWLKGFGQVWGMLQAS